MAQRFEKGIVVRAAGKTIKANEGPDRGIEASGIPDNKLIFPI